MKVSKPYIGPMGETIYVVLPENGESTWGYERTLWPELKYDEAQGEPANYYYEANLFGGSDLAEVFAYDHGSVRHRDYSHILEHAKSNSSPEYRRFAEILETAHREVVG